MTDTPTANRYLTYDLNGTPTTRLWVSENNFTMPKKVIAVADEFSAKQYIQLASQGVSFVWTGDFQNAKHLLQAVQRRIPEKSAQGFYQHRQHQAYKAQLLSRLLIPVEKDLSVSLRRAPDMKQAIAQAIKTPEVDFIISLRELMGFIGAFEWRKKGVTVRTLENQKIHAYYGVFSPVRGEYLDLVAQAPLPVPLHKAFDIGTGTGVISAILASRGIKEIVATDLDDRALECAKENIQRLGFGKIVHVTKADLFPEGKADLIVCNPPWLPVKPTSAIENAVYDDESKMLKGFLSRVAQHLSNTGEAWLIISDLAEHLDLRKIGEIENWIEQGQLSVIDCLKILPRHGKAQDIEDSLHAARSKEVTKLWRLKKIGSA